MDTRQIKIFAEGSYPRLNYIAGLLLGDILGLQWEIVNDRRRLGKCPSISYSDEKVPNSFRISPSGILSETGVAEKELVITEWMSLPVFFQSDTGSDIPFDIFSSSFFLVSRYEEYLEHQPDEHGRFRASSSLAFRNGFLGRPVVDLWAKEFARLLIQKFPTLTIRRNEFRTLLTIDADQPFAYLGKNLLRSVGGIIRDLTVNSGQASDRYKVVTHERKDPYEVFDYIMNNIDTYKIAARFFFPVGDHSKFDKNPSWKNAEYRELITRITDRYPVGLHPSYNSSGNFELLETEIDRIRKITGTELQAARYHYIRLFMPLSYRNLVKAGITEDYSMGYPDEPGFRAGIARPFLFYDVLEDKHTELKIIPFQVMDATLYQYKNLDAGRSAQIITELIDETRNAGGLFVSLWHNTTLLESGEWLKWRQLFESMLILQQS